MPSSIVKLDSSKEWSDNIISFDLGDLYKIVIYKIGALDYSAQFLLRCGTKDEYGSICVAQYFAPDRKTAIEKAVVELYAYASAHIELMKTVQCALEVKNQENGNL